MFKELEPLENELSVAVKEFLGGIKVGLMENGGVDAKTYSVEAANQKLHIHRLIIQGEIQHAAIVSLMSLLIEGITLNKAEAQVVKNSLIAGMEPVIKSRIDEVRRAAAERKAAESKILVPNVNVNKNILRGK